MTPDRDSERYWAAAAEGRLEIQRCDGCGAFRWPPRSICDRCASFEHAWIATRGRGRVMSWVTTHQVYAKALADAVPYHVVSVALDEQPDVVLVGNLLGGAPRDQLPVRAVFPDGLVQWEPAETG